MRTNVKWLIGLIIFFFIGTIFVAWGVGGGAADRRNKNYAARVYGRIISVEALNRAEENNRALYRRIYGERFNSKLAKALKLRENALRGLIKRELLIIRAGEMGIMVSDRAVTNNIKTDRNFQTNGRFDMRKYKMVLKYNRLSPEMYEAKIKEDLLSRYLEEIISAQAKVSSQETREAYIQQNETVKAELIKFEGKDFLDRVKVTDRETGDYFSNHKTEFRIPEQRRGVTLLVDPAGLKVSPATERDIEEYYLLNKSDFQVAEQVKASHILFKTADKEKVKAKAEEVLKKIRQGKDFAEMAKKYSEDTTAKDGGDLGYFQRGVMVSEFDRAAFAMKKGEVSDLIKTSFGYHIIKVTDLVEAHIKSLEKSRKDIVSRLREERRLNKAEKLVETCYDQLLSGADIKQVADRNSVKLKEGILKPLNNKSPNRVLASLKLNEISQIIRNPKTNIYKIVKLVEIKESYIPELKEVAAKVELALKREKALSLAGKSAQDFFDKVKGGKKFTELARKLNKKIEETNAFTSTGFITPVGRLAGTDSLFDLKEGDLSLPLKKGNNYYLFKIKKHKRFDEKEFLAQKEIIEERLQREKGSKQVLAWLQKELQSSEIEIQQQVLR
ncbi:MAG: SurA N-terminal domain-containing protein [bacterium]